MCEFLSVRKEKGRADARPLFIHYMESECLPGAAGLAAAAVLTGSHGAGARDVAGVLRDEELVAGLRHGGHDVARRVVGVVDLARARADRQAGRSLRDGAGGLGVDLFGREAGLDLGDHVASVGLRRGILTLDTLAE